MWSLAFWRPPADAPRSTATAAARCRTAPLGLAPEHATPRATVLVDTAPRALPRTMLGATAAMTLVGLLITVVAGPLFAYTQRAAADLTSRDPYITSVLPVEVRR